MNAKSLTLSNVVAGLYEAGMDAAHWPEAALQVGSLTQSCSSIMWFERANPKVILYEEGSLNTCQRNYVSGLYLTDPAYEYAMHAPLDVPGTIHDFGPREVYERSEIHQAMLRDDVVARARSVVVRTARQIAYVGLWRKNTTGQFDAKSLQRLKDLSPHVRRAIQLTHHLKTLERGVGSLMQVLDRIEHGVFLVDEKLRVTYFNEEGRRILRHSGVLSVKRRQLQAAAVSESAALLDLLRASAQTAMGAGAHSGGYLTLHDQDGQACLFLDVTPLRGGRVASDHMEQAPYAMVVCRAPNHEVIQRPEAVRQYFRLSPAEARLALDLVQGETLKAIAERRGVAFGTVRAQLISIFDKTGVRRQAELVRLVMAVSTGLVDHSLRSEPHSVRMTGGA